MKNAILVAWHCSPVSCPDRRQNVPDRVESMPCSVSSKTQPDSRAAKPGQGEMRATDKVIVIRAGETDAGQRLDRVLAQHLPLLSRTRLKRLIETGQVTHEGSVLRDPSLRVRYDQYFVVILPQIEDAAPVAQPIALE